MTTEIPEGFMPWVPSSQFMSHVAQIGPLYQNKTGSVLALRLEAGHSNMHNRAHGGLLAALADCALGNYVSNAFNVSVVTVSMTIDYLDAAQIGDWLEAHVSVDKRGRRLIYASCILRSGDATMVKVSGVFAARAAQQPASDG